MDSIVFNKVEYYRALNMEPYEVTVDGVVLHKLRHLVNAGKIQLSAKSTMEVK